MSLSISSILLLAPMHKTGMKMIIIVIMVLDVNFSFLLLKLCLIRLVELFHFCVIACDGNAIFTGWIRMGKQSWNRTTNQMNCNNKKVALKNEIVMCFRLRIDRARAYISGIQTDRFFFNEWIIKMGRFRCEC